MSACILSTYVQLCLCSERWQSSVKLCCSLKPLHFIVSQWLCFFICLSAFWFFLRVNTRLSAVHLSWPPSVLSNGSLYSFVHFKAFSLTIQTDNLLRATAAQPALQMSPCRKRSLILSTNVSNMDSCLFLPMQVKVFSMLLGPLLKTFCRHGKRFWTTKMEKVGTRNLFSTFTSKNL